MLRGKKTSAKAAGGTLRSINLATDWDMHLSNPLVLSQLRPVPLASECKEEPVAALTPPVDMVSRLEELVRLGTTPQVRCLAGFFVCLAYGSLRTSDLQSSKSLELAEDAVVGKALMKNN